MSDDVRIGHGPILSGNPIIARPEISDVIYRDFRTSSRMRRNRSEAERKAVGRRLQGARKDAGLTQQDVSARLKLRQSVVSDWETGALESWVGYADDLAELYGVDVDSLQALAEVRDIEMIEAATLEPEQPRVVDRSDLPAFIEVPEYEVRLSAGAGFIVHDEEPVGAWPFERRYLVDELGLHASHLAVVRIQGDSMYPTLHSGDRVLIDRADVYAGAEGVFAIWNGAATVVKRVELIQPPQDPPSAMLISDNKSHNQYAVLLEEMKVIGRVVWYARRL